MTDEAMPCAFNILTPPSPSVTSLDFGANAYHSMSRLQKFFNWWRCERNPDKLRDEYRCVYIHDTCSTSNTFTLNWSANDDKFLKYSLDLADSK